MQASVRELKDKLSECLRRVQQGEEILITSHRRPIAKLVPLPSSERGVTPDRQRYLQELEEVRKNVGLTPGEPLSQTVLNMRNEARY